MHGRSCCCLLALSLLFLMLSPLRGQSDRAGAAPDFPPEFNHSESERSVTDSPPVSTLRRRLVITGGAFNFTQLSQAAGMIFSGTVTAIARRPATNAQTVETVSITFRVEEALRGTTPGENLTIRQWIGLWTSGQRYRVGERVLVFLYPPSKLGLTSSVAGPIGRFGVDLAGRVLLSAQHLSAFRTDPVLGGRSRVTLTDFARAVRLAAE